MGIDGIEIKPQQVPWFGIRTGSKGQRKGVSVVHKKVESLGTGALVNVDLNPEARALTGDASPSRRDMAQSLDVEVELLS